VIDEGLDGELWAVIEEGEALRHGTGGQGKCSVGQIRHILDGVSDRLSGFVRDLVQSDEKFRGQSESPVRCGSESIGNPESGGCFLRETFVLGHGCIVNCYLAGERFVRGFSIHFPSVVIT